MNLSKDVRFASKMACLRTADCRLQACTSSVLPVCSAVLRRASAFFSVPQGQSAFLEFHDSLVAIFDSMRLLPMVILAMTGLWPEPGSPIILWCIYSQMSLKPRSKSGVVQVPLQCRYVAGSSSLHVFILTDPSGGMDVEVS
ncbi:unnamed protein product [Rodentolepis nana]|uniref:Uncharacterized protein n=1 Tax=Rodentolepis nana TaxID=102285 RepID=A0A0R3U058_RODNA|nr:unnamed protein product [Rodentolepis nana]